MTVEAQEALARLAMWERVHAALQRLDALGPVSEVVEHVAQEAAAASGLDRVVLSALEGRLVVAESVYVRDDPECAAALLKALRSAPVTIDYPLVEGEMVRRRRSLIVSGKNGQEAVPSAYSEVIGWGGFVAVPIILEGRVIGFLHGDRPGSADPLCALDEDCLGLFAEGFARILERGVLRRRLRSQRQEIRKIASWADARTSELGDRAIDLAAAREDGGPAHSTGRPVQGWSALHDLLTRREMDVLERMVQGDTNADIARALVVSEGTVKYHVKNILRKMQVANRAEATSKYLHMTLGRS